MLFDTHCHLNFKVFENRVEEVINRAKKAGVNNFLVPGTDLKTSKKAVELAEKFSKVYAAVGIHPHHVYELMGPAASFPPAFAKASAGRPASVARPSKSGGRSGAGSPSSHTTHQLLEIEKLLEHEKVVAIGEVGLDKHYYQKTKYEGYQINDDFLNLQKMLFKEQIKLAIKYKKSLIIHSREAAEETLKIIGESSILKALAGRMVFHCCEAEDKLLEFALAHQIYIGVDGDVTYGKKPFGSTQVKQEFVKKIPLNLLVLETDSPFLLPEPLRTQKKFPNEPRNLVLIAEMIANLKKTSIKRLIEITTENAKKLFQV